MEVKRLRELYSTLIYLTMYENHLNFVLENNDWKESFKAFLSKGHSYNSKNIAFELMNIYNSINPEDAIQNSYQFNRERAEMVWNYLEQEGILTWNHNSLSTLVKLTDFDKICQLFEGTTYTMESYRRGGNYGVGPVHIKDLKSGAVLFDFLRDPQQYTVTPSNYGSTMLYSTILPNNIESRKKKTSLSTKKKQKLRGAVSLHFIESMSLITGHPMDKCLGIRFITSPIPWTPTIIKDTQERFELQLKELQRIQDDARESQQQMLILQKLYTEHGEGIEFLNWAAQQLEEKLLEDPGKYMSHKLFGVATKAVLACS